MTSRTGEPRSHCYPAPSVGASRCVGDPVDLITGAVLDHETDFRVPTAAVPFSWVRYYDSRAADQDRGLGRGFRHDLDHELHKDLDGLTYVDPTGAQFHLPQLQRDGQWVREQGIELTRLSAQRYRVSRAADRHFELTFSADARVAQLQTIEGKDGKLTLRYDTSSSQLQSVDLGEVGSLHLDWSDGRISRIRLHESATGREQTVARFRYDAHGCLVEVENAYQHRLRYEYDAVHRLVRKQDRRGYAYLFVYDKHGRCIDSRGQDGAEAVQLEYRPLERTTLVTRHDGGKWQYQYTDYGLITHILDPAGGMQSFVPDDAGRVREEVDPLGNVERIEYDVWGTPRLRIDQFGNRTPIDPDDGTSEPEPYPLPENPLEYSLGATFAAPDQPLPSEPPVWDVPQRVRAELYTVAPDAPPRQFVRNVLGLPVRLEVAPDKALRWAFDENANMRWQIDADGGKHHLEYSPSGQLARIIDPIGAVTHYEHTPSGKISKIVDPGGTTSAYIRDHKDRVIEVHRHGKLRERYVYDAADNLVEKRSADGTPLLEQSFGPGNRVTSQRFAGGATHNFDYDAAGRIAQARSPAGTVTLSHSPSGARTADLRDGLGTTHQKLSSNASTTTVLGRFVTRYERAPRGGLSVIDPTGARHELRQLAPGVIETRFASGMREVAQYDTEGQCRAKAHFGGPNDLTPWVRGFRLSAEGQLLERTDSARGSARYDYDAAGRLQYVHHARAGTEKYAYDAAGNLTHMPSFLPEARGIELTERFEVGAGNQLRQAFGERFAYDDRDNISYREGPFERSRYLRDSFDQLVEIHNSRYRFSAKYDAFGRRTEKTVDGKSTQHYWDGDRLIAEVLPTGTLRVYVYTDPLAMVPLMFVDYASIDAAPESGHRAYVLTDHLGAVERVVADSGALLWRARLDPYGLAHVEVGKHFHQPLRWPGHYCDAETGLHYNRFRYYDPKLGRYLESDPLGIEGGTNLYAYADHPLRDVDLRGLHVCPDSVQCKLAQLVQKRGRPTHEEMGKSGLTLAQRKLFRARVDKAKSPKSKARLRFTRYSLAKLQLGKGDAMLKWARYEKSHDNARANKTRGEHMETEGRNALAKHRGVVLKDNNQGKPVKGHETRPDSTGDGLIHEHKHKMGTGDQVVENDKQMRNQRAMTGPKGEEMKHVVTISSDKPELNGKPPKPRPDAELGKKSTVYYVQPSNGPGNATGEPRITHEWDHKRGKWRGLP